MSGKFHHNSYHDKQIERGMSGIMLTIKIVGILWVMGALAAVASQLIADILWLI